MLREIAHRLGLTNAKRFARSVAGDRRKSPGEYAVADGVLSAFHSSGGLDWALQPYKLVTLDRLVRRLRPRSILEIGSGSSTVVFARYAQEEGADFTSVDESEQWIANTVAMLQRFGVHSAVSTKVCSKSIDLLRREARYLDMPRITADLVFIDGPALEVDGNKVTDAACIDILSLPRPKYIIVDMRKPTVERLSIELADEYDLERSDVLLSSPRELFNYFSIFSQR